ncbi:MAG: RICIN domain-containing protein [Burkholderiales bacterium]|nr:RICIN domain-containing protein [Burkholderiales bacterium]
MNACVCVRRSLSRLAYVFLACALAACGGGSQDAGGAAGASATSSASATGRQHAESNVTATPLAAAATVVSIENGKPGTTAWQLSNPALAHEIEGYASVTSVNRGGRIDFMVNTAATTFNVDIYRMGWYGGAGGRLLKTYTNVPGTAQPMPCLNPDGVIECNWSPNISLIIPATTTTTSLAYWASGIYLAKLSTDTTPKKESYIIFVVRDDARNASFVSQLPITTYQAYNYWGGKSLYTGCETHDYWWTCLTGTPAPKKVSFNRPFGKSSNPPAAIGVGAGEFLTNVQPVLEGTPISSAGFDYNMVRWMERQGYDVKYISNLDLHENSAVLSQAKAFISTGHDEYYSKPMWDNLIAARGAGINLAFFSSNQIFWQVRFADGAYGLNKKNRIMICYRGGGDPVGDNNLTTDQFRWLGRPEASLIGNQYVKDPIMGDVTITNAAHWLFAGSGLWDGAVINGALGYEINAYVPGVSPAQTRILAHSLSGGYASDMTFYVDASSAQVFATGTMQWSWALDDYIPNNLRPAYYNWRADVMTANVFDALAEKNLSTFTSINSPLYLSTPANNLEAAQVVQDIAPSGTQKNNRWRVLPSGDAGYYLIVGRANGLCLDAYGWEAGVPAGTWDCHGGDNQKWSLVTVSADQIALVEKRTGRCLAVPNAGTAAGTGLMIANCDYGPSQLWKRTALN